MLCFIALYVIMLQNDNAQFYKGRKLFHVCQHSATISLCKYEGDYSQILTLETNLFNNIFGIDLLDAWVVFSINNH